MERPKFHKCSDAVLLPRTRLLSSGSTSSPLSESALPARMKVTSLHLGKETGVPARARGMDPRRFQAHLYPSTQPSPALVTSPAKG